MNDDRVHPQSSPGPALGTAAASAVTPSAPLSPASPVSASPASAPPSAAVSQAATAPGATASSTTDGPVQRRMALISARTGIPFHIVFANGRVMGPHDVEPAFTIRLKSRKAERRVALMGYLGIFES